MNKSMQTKSAQELNELAARIHKLNEKWWISLETGERIERNKGELLMLVISELSEGNEGIRKDLMDDHLPYRKMEEVEMADAAIRLFDFAGGYGLTLDDINQDMLEFIPDNKAECLFCISRAVIDIGVSGRTPTIAISMIVNYCTKFNLDLWSTVEEKLEYNKTRQDHTHEARKQANGKKF